MTATTDPTSLTPHQRAFLNSTTPMTAFVGGRGSGKTYVGVRWALAMMEEFPQTVGLITANSYQQLHQSTLRPLFIALAEREIPYVFGEEPNAKWFTSTFKSHRNVLSLRSGAQAITRSLTNYDDVRGQEIGWWWGDEVRDTRREAFDVTLACLRDRRGPCQLKLTTTPNGYDWLYQVFVAEPLARPALSAARSLIRSTTYDNRANLADTFIQTLLDSYDDDLARQEINAEFIPMGRGRVYVAFDRELHVRSDLELDCTRPLVLACDFNVAPIGWVIGQRSAGAPPALQRSAGAALALQRSAGAPPALDHANHAGKLPALLPDLDVVLDEVWIPRPPVGMSAVQAAARAFTERYGEHPHEVHVYGDAAGNARNSATTDTDYAVLLAELRRAPIGPRVQLFQSRANPAVADRVNIVNARLRNATGDIGLLISPRARRLIRDLEEVLWHDGVRQIDKTRDATLTHVSDALGYWLWSTRRPSATATWTVLERGPVPRGLAYD